jgi:formylglycine-generating enzyme required for sulfatase activity
MGITLVLVSLFMVSMTGCAFAWPWGGSDAPAENFEVRPSLEIAANEPSAAPASQPAPSRLIRNSLGMEFVLIPPGQFVMGSPNNPAAQPLRQVSISRPIYMGRFPVTQAEWQRIMGDNPSWKAGCQACPVEQVSYLDVLHFLKKLNAMDRGNYRLPTEAEWEYAVRAGSSGTYFFGEETSRLGEYAWFFRNAESGAKPVGQKRPNPWGLHDVHGNVWEWVRDWYQPYPPARQAVNPVGPANGKFKVIRGGSWTNDFDLLGSATRMKVRPTNRHLNLGFRVVLVPGRQG